MSLFEEMDSDEYLPHIDEQMKMVCLTRAENTTPPYIQDSYLYCPITWDGFLCWDYTKNGTTAAQSCPNFWEHMNPGNATRICEASGEWRVYDDNPRNGTWTDFGSCESAPVRDHPSFLQIVYSIGYSISVVTLIIAMAIFLYFPKLRCPRNKIHMNLFMSFILRAIFIFIRDILQAMYSNELLSINDDLDNAYDKVSTSLYGNSWCRLSFTLIQYFLVANYYWLLVEGVYIHSLITLAVFSGKSSLKYYLLLGWGFPATVALPWSLVHIVRREPGCWWEHVTRDDIYWLIKAPVMLSIVVNFVLFLNIIRVLFTKIRASNVAESRGFWRLVKSTMVLIPMFGVYYIVTVGMLASTNETVVLVRMYVDLCISPYQGAVLAVIYCFLNGEVQAEISRKWQNHLITRTLSTNQSLAPKRSVHSRSSVSTPPRKHSLKGDGDMDEENSYHGRSSFRRRLATIKKRIFGKKTRHGRMNGLMKLENSDINITHLENEVTQPLNFDMDSLCHNDLKHEDGHFQEQDEVKVSKENDADDDSGHVQSGDSRTPSYHENDEEKKGKGVSFASNIETEV